jgi:hypothetical protein
MNEPVTRRSMLGAMIAVMTLPFVKGPCPYCESFVDDFGEPDELKVVIDASPVFDLKGIPLPIIHKDFSWGGIK